MKALNTFYTRILLTIVLTAIMAVSTNAQFRSGAMSINAGMAMPSGTTLSAGVPTTTLGTITFTYTFASTLGYVVNDNLELNLGIGYVTASFGVPSGQTAPDNQNLFSLSLGGKYFLSANNMVMPYLGAGFSVTSFPSSTFQTTTVSASLTTVVAYFGAQSFLNNSKSIALFIQFGLGYNKGSQTTDNDGSSASKTQTNINFGGSAFGGSIYF